jgi:hypothetical protein
MRGITSSVTKLNRWRGSGCFRVMVKAFHAGQGIACLKTRDRRLRGPHPFSHLLLGQSGFDSRGDQSLREREFRSCHGLLNSNFAMYVKARMLQIAAVSTS